MAGILQAIDSHGLWDYVWEVVVANCTALWEQGAVISHNAKQKSLRDAGKNPCYCCGFPAIVARLLLVIVL
jgi:hypothetical protein